jgi:Zn-finger nucleic acid-binding protein
MNHPTHSSDPPITPPVAFDQGGTLVDRPSGVNCPNCRTPLVIGEIHACQFAGCPTCGGMLFQQPVFAMLIQHLRATSAPSPMMPKPLEMEQLQVKRPCPSCFETLETHAYAGAGNAVIDTCFACGLIWFDQGELTKLVRAPGKR